MSFQFKPLTFELIGAQFIARPRSVICYEAWMLDSSSIFHTQEHQPEYKAIMAI